MADVSFALADTKRVTRVWITAHGEDVCIDLDAHDVSVLIDSLVNVRAQMLDEVPMKFETAPVFRNVAKNPPTICGMENASAKEMYVGFRHPGLGWTAITFAPEAAGPFMRTFSQVALTMRPGGIIRA